MSDSLWPHELQHTRLLCPPLSPGVCSDSCLLGWWCYLTISSFVTPFSFCILSFLTSRSFPLSQLLASGGQTVGVSASASVLPMNIQGWFPVGLTALISLQSKGLSRVFSSTTFKSINSMALRVLCGPTVISVNDYWKNHNFEYVDICWQSDVSAF